MAVVNDLHIKYERELKQVLAGNNRFDRMKSSIDFIY